MSHINKYKANKEWANLAYEQEEYDIAINRYYYSIFQKMLDELNSNGITLQINEQHNSHNYTSSRYAEKLIKGNNMNATFKIRTCFNTGFASFKKLRHSADYKEQHITSREAKQAQRFFIQLDEII